MSAGHSHTHGMAKQVLRLAFFLTLIVLAAEVTGGWLANSLALLSDAGHVLTDIFALGLAWFAAEQAERPANARKTFGYHRVGILAALANALTLILITIWILWQAIGRFQHPEPVQPVVMFVSAGIGIVVNLFIGFGLRKEGDYRRWRGYPADWLVSRRPYTLDRHCRAHRVWSVARSARNLGDTAGGCAGRCQPFGPRARYDAGERYRGCA